MKKKYNLRGEMDTMKVVVVGAQGVGKTSFVNKWIDPTNNSKLYFPTTGFPITDIKHNGIHLKICEVPGTHNYNMTDFIYDGASAVLVFCRPDDLTLEIAKKYVSKIPDIPIILVVNSIITDALENKKFMNKVESWCQNESKDGKKITTHLICTENGIGCKEVQNALSLILNYNTRKYFRF